MTILSQATNATKSIESSNGVYQAYQKLIDANGKIEIAAAASQLVAEIFIAGIVTATVRTSLSTVRLGLAITGQAGKWEAVSWAAGAASGMTAGAIIDWANAQEIGGKIYDWTHPVSDAIGAAPDPLVRTYRYSDPLILDLDGDGVKITAMSQGILFDTNGDSIKTGTAWASANDGILVLDRNGNGMIDSGAELFGDETILTNGQKAVHGFAALRDLDTGSIVNGIIVGAGNGVFDAQDIQFINVRVWRDLNQDGISQADELKTLVETGVQSVKLASTNANIDYGDALLTQSSTFIRTDGSIGQLGNFNFAQNNFVRAFDPITVSTAAKLLPAIKGSGWVRDLQEAATLNPELITLVNQVRDAPTRAGYVEAIAALLRKWGNESGYDSAGKQSLQAGYGLILSEPADAQEAAWMHPAIKASELERNDFRVTLSEAERLKFDAMRERMTGGLEKIYAYEAFTGHTFLDWAQVRHDAFDYTPRFSPTGTRRVEVSVPLSQVIFENRNAFLSSQEGYIRVDVPVSAGSIFAWDTLWTRLVDDVTLNLMTPLRISPYLDLIDLDLSTSNFVYDFSRLEAALTEASTANAVEGAAYFIDIYRIFGQLLDTLGWNGAEQMQLLSQRAVADADLREAIQITGLNFL